MDDNAVKLFRSKGSDDWATPAWLYNQLNEEFNFNCDPCPLKAEIDGLQTEWHGSIFVNPPYSNVEGFLIKAHEELRNGNAHTVVFLVFANTDTKWFHRYIYHVADEIRFIEGRIKFVMPGKIFSAMRPSMVVVFRGK
jgi:phage N-6-adenine-methyltransferase